MALLGIPDLLTILDSLAKGAQLFEEAVGVDATTPDSIAEGAENNRVTLVDALGTGVDATALLLAFEARRDLVHAAALFRTLLGEPLQVALDAHYGGTGGLNRLLTAEDARAHPDLRKLGIQVDAVNAFPPAVVTLGSFAVSGAGAGTFTPASDIDQSLYGKANTVVKTTTAIGGATITATLTMKTIDRTTVPVIVTIPNGTLAGVEIDVGVHGTDMFVGVAAISIAGGTAGEGFEVRTEIERTLVL
jgi:hypothetical protein